VERGVSITDLASKFLAQESDSAEAGNSVVAVCLRDEQGLKN